MNKRLIASLVRHLLTVAGGAGLFSESEMETLASAVLILIGLLWSYLEKRAAEPEPLPVSKIVQLHERAERKKVGKSVD